MRHETSHQWDKRSRAQLQTLHTDLRLVLEDALRLSDVPFQVVQGARTIEQQREYFAAGKSKVDPDSYGTPAELYAAARHVVGAGAPLSRAADIIVGVAGRTYDLHHLCYVAGVVLTCARIRGVSLRWGGDWDKDGELLYDQRFDDAVHFEMD